MFICFNRFFPLLGTINEDIDDHIQKLVLERDAAPHKFGSLTSLGERVFPDTSAVGREKIRCDLRELRERWDTLEIKILDQQKNQELLLQQQINYQDTISNATAWIENAEKTVPPLDSVNWTSVQDLRSKLGKNKVYFQ